MFPSSVARTVARAAVRPVARAPASRSMLARRQMSAAPAAKKVEQGTDELWPFAKNIPVDVYPLVVMVSIVCCGSLFMIGKHLTQDKSLRLKPSGSH